MWLTPSPVNAEEAEPVRLEYRIEASDDSCPSEGHLRDAVAARLGYVPFSTEASRRVVATISPVDEGLLARVQLFDGSGNMEAEQEIRSDEADCETLAVSMTRSIANAIDPRLFLSPRTPPEPEPPGPPPTPDVEEPAGRCPDQARDAAEPEAAEDVNPPRSERRRRLRWDTGGAMHVAVGAGPGVTAGGSLFASMGGRFWSALLEIRVDGPSRKDDSNGGRVAMWQLLPTLGGCARVWWFEGCALLGLGMLHAWGRGVDVSRREVVFHAAAGARVAFSLPLTRRLAIRIQADLLVPLTPTNLELDGRVVWEMPSVSGAFGLGLAGTF